MTAIAEPSATGSGGHEGLVKLDPEDLAGRLGSDADEIAAAVRELADRSLLLSPEGQDDDVWQVNPMVAFQGPAAAQCEVLERVVEQRGVLPVLPEPGTVLVSAATGKTFRA
ncbi:hypothetical protein [Kitasatospora sp. NPDC050463]|uniref:hypothetical protein n=1 Tax=Kitasatospora sp. NPDC050463 TaxID=3155786 RepID=UPI0033E265A0